MGVARQRFHKTASEVRNYAFSFADALDDGELLTGTPTVVEVDTADLTIDNKAINTAEVDHDQDGVVASNKAVLFRVAGGTAGTTYTIRITVSTDATAAQTFIDNAKIHVTED